MTGSWRPSRTVELDARHQDAASLIFGTDQACRFAWDLMGGTLCYAADLIPEIADDIVNVDRALRWGFNWARGPFELLDALGPKRVAERLEAEGRACPGCFRSCGPPGAERFYREDGRHLGFDGAWHERS